MGRRLRMVLAAFFYYSGLVRIAIWWRRLSSRRLIILNYHCAIGGDLRQHLLYLWRNYRIVHLEDGLEELYSFSGGKKQNDRRTPLVITFDDGHRDNYMLAFVLARELQVPITIFLPPGYIESGDNFWWQESERLVHHGQVEKVILEDSIYQLKHQDERKVLMQVIDTHLRYAKSVAERGAFLADIRSALAVPLSFTPEEELKLPMTWEQIREMDQSGLVKFGAHTMNHPILSRLADPAEVQQEVRECRAMLEEKLGYPIRSFAYPIGKPKDIGEETLRAVKEAGYTWALTTVSGVNTPQSDPHQLLRVPINVGQHWLLMAALVSGVWQLFSPLWAKL